MNCYLEECRSLLRKEKEALEKRSSNFTLVWYLYDTEISVCLIYKTKYGKLKAWSSIFEREEVDLSPEQNIFATINFLASEIKEYYSRELSMYSNAYLDFADIVDEILKEN